MELPLLPRLKRYAMAASTFVSGARQVSAIQSTSMQEEESTTMMQVILPFLSRSAASQVRRVLAGESENLTRAARLEVDGMIAGYLNRTPTQ